MIRALIDVSIKNRFMVLIAALLISFAGWQAMKTTPPARQRLAQAGAGCHRGGLDL